jgi:hypothetical protein
MAICEDSRHGSERQPSRNNLVTLDGIGDSRVPLQSMTEAEAPAGPG